MTRAQTIATVTMILIAGILIGAVATPTPEPAPTPTPAPTAEPTATPEPTPKPTPTTIEIEVPYMPLECIDAILYGLDVNTTLIDFHIDVLSAYVDYPEEDLVAFAHRVEDIMLALSDEPAASEFEATHAKYMEAVDDCTATIASEDL